MKDSQILKIVRKAVKNHHTYICHELENFEGVPKYQLSGLIAWVRSMLTKEHYSYDGWLDKKLGRSLSYTEAQQARLQWLDWMIAYCEQQERYGSNIVKVNYSKESGGYSFVHQKGWALFSTYYIPKHEK